MQRSVPFVCALALVLAACADDSPAADDPDSSTSSTPTASGDTTGPSADTSTGPDEPGSSGDDDDDATDADDDDDATDADDDDDDDDDATTAAGCTDNSDCRDPDAPFCLNTGECAPCGETSSPNGSCTVEFPATPVCVNDQCVECDADNVDHCTDQGLVCNAETNLCDPCTAESQCEGAACNFIDGTCGSPDHVYYVDGDHEACEAGDGSQEAPYCDIFLALGQVEPGTFTTIYVAAMAGWYDEDPVIHTDEQVALVAADATDPPTIDGFGEPTITLEPGALLVMDGLIVRGNSSHGGIAADDASLYVAASRIIQNNGPGLTATDGDVTVVNSFISGVANAYPAMLVDGGVVRVIYSTLGRTFNLGLGVIECPSPTNLDIRNSLIINNSLEVGVEVDCFGARTLNTVLVTDADPKLWFDDFYNGNYSLTFPPPAWLTTAVWQGGDRDTPPDPPTDINGDPRPTVDGAADVVGADIPDER